jgi:hypothetical protein
VTFVKVRYTLPVVLLCFKISAAWSTPSSVTIDTHSGVCIDIGTKNARFEILPSGYVRAYLWDSGGPRPWTTRVHKASLLS